MNSMKDILSAFNNAGNGKNSQKSNSSSMKQLLESLDNIQEASTLNISMTGDTPDDVNKLYNTVTGNAEYEVDDPVTYGNDGYADHEDDVFQGTLSGSGTLNRTQEEYNNEPEEEYQDIDDIINKSSDDLHKTKSGYDAAHGGDNPRSVKEQKLKEELSRSLRRHMRSLDKKNDY